MKYNVDHIPLNTAKNRRPGHAMSPTTITIHNTGNPNSTARNERSWLTNPSNGVTASYHIVVDEHEAIECIPLNEVGWAAGDGSNGPGNRTSIHIEICESGDYSKTLDNAVELVAKMLKERGWGVDKLRRHFDWSKKICPRLMYDNGKWSSWNEFKKMVATKLKPIKVPKGVSDWAEDGYRFVLENGISDGKRPKDPITREEVWAMLERMSKLNSYL